MDKIKIGIANNNLNNYNKKDVALSGTLKNKIDSINFTNPINDEMINNLKERVNKAEDICILSKNKYSNTNYSDADNIYVHKLCKIMVNLQNDLKKYSLSKETNIDYYKIYAQYCTGMELGNIGGKIELTEENIQKMQQTLNEMQLDENVEIIINNLNEVLIDKNGNENYKLDIDEIKTGSFVINKIVSEESGYDATVLVDSDGNYMIVNSSTNDQQIEDLAIIADTISNQFFPNQDFAEQILEILVENTDLIYQINENIGKNYLASCRDAQVSDNKKLITEIAKRAKEEGKTVGLYGYSLGGGIQLTSFSEITFSINYTTNNLFSSSFISEDLENMRNLIRDTISSVTVYNPFVSVVEQSKNGNELINYLCKSDKILIYSAEEDYVSIFNNSVGKLVDSGKMIFIPSVDLANPLRQLTNEELSSLSDEQKEAFLKENKYIAVDGLNDFMKLIIGSVGNHGFKYIEDDNNFSEESCFDENGNLIREGKFKSISDSLSESMNGEWGKTEKCLNYSVDYNKIINLLFELSDISLNLTDVQKESVEIILEYIKNNTCNYNYDEFVSTIGDAVWIIVEDEISKKGTVLNTIASIFKDRKSFDEALNSFLTDEKNKEKIIKLIYYYVNLNLNRKEFTNSKDSETIEKYNHDIEDAQQLINQLLNSLDDYYSNNINSNSLKYYSFLVSFSYDVTNSQIKEAFCSQLKKTLENLLPKKI